MNEPATLADPFSCPFCGTDVNKHEAARCLDAWFDRDLLGYDVELSKGDWRRVFKRKHNSVTFSMYGIPQYSKGWSTMGYLAELLRADGWLVVIKVMPKESSYILQGSRSEYDAPCDDKLVAKGMCMCDLEDMRGKRDFKMWRHSEMGIAPDAPLALVRATLKTAIVNREGPGFNIKDR